MSVGGVNISQFFKTSLSGLDSEGSALQTKIDSLGKNGSVEQKDLLEIQYAMGQYNAKLEAVSSMMKSMQDMLKSLAQRTG